jgi:micrococcal nuclease
MLSRRFPFRQKDLRQPWTWVLIAFLVLTAILRLDSTDEGGLVIPSISPARMSPAVNGDSTDELVLVERVIDGDTIEIQGGQIVRYIGIDTPETQHPTKGIECYGLEAAQANRELVEGRYVRLVKDVSETDRFGRLLRYVYVEDVFVNDELVKRGFARMSTFPPDVKFQPMFLESQKSAQQNERGLWKIGACKEMS